MLEKELLLKEWNNGILRGARLKLAKVLQVSTTTVLRWFDGEQVSEENVKKLAEIFKKPKKEIERIFRAKQGCISCYSGIGHSGDGNKGNIQYPIDNLTKLDILEELRMLYEKLDLKVEEKINTLKLTQENLALKLDLILEKLKK
ncbi:MAG: hypothetical protein LBU55_03565 [Elusimicrobiota bacterium]|jgi:hypothetical protein|nr:hypothetical protein [Elusimicrobiota bacterium]